MLDNHLPDRLGPAAKYIKEKYPHVIVEASGGVTIATLQTYFLPHVRSNPRTSAFLASRRIAFSVSVVFVYSVQVDVISMGSLIQSVQHIDFSLNIGAKVQKKL